MSGELLSFLVIMGAVIIYLVYRMLTHKPKNEKNTVVEFQNHKFEYKQCLNSVEEEVINWPPASEKNFLTALGKNGIKGLIVLIGGNRFDKTFYHEFMWEKMYSQASIQPKLDNFRLQVETYNKLKLSYLNSTNELDKRSILIDIEIFLFSVNPIILPEEKHLNYRDLTRTTPVKFNLMSERRRVFNAHTGYYNILHDTGYVSHQEDIYGRRYDSSGKPERH